MPIFYTTDAHGVYLGCVVVSEADTEEEARANILQALKNDYSRVAEEELKNFSVFQMEEKTEILWDGDY